jgi:hypothetical protein
MTAPTEITIRTRYYFVAYIANGVKGTEHGRGWVSCKDSPLHVGHFEKEVARKRGFAAVAVTHFQEVDVETHTINGEDLA